MTEKHSRWTQTIWALIIKARKDKNAFSDFVNKYRPTIYNYLLDKGFSQQDAEDLTQEIFIKIWDYNVLQKADQAKGKFRCLMLAITKNVVNEYLRKSMAKKRGIGKPTIPVDQIVLSDEKDEKFDRLWVKNLTTIALAKLKKECQDKNLPYFDALYLYAFEEMDYDKIAQKLNKSKTESRNYIHRGRSKLKEYVKDLIKQYSSSRKEYETEINYLFRFL